MGLARTPGAGPVERRIRTFEVDFGTPAGGAVVRATVAFAEAVGARNPVMTFSGDLVADPVINGGAHLDSDGVVELAVFNSDAGNQTVGVVTVAVEVALQVPPGP